VECDPEFLLKVQLYPLEQFQVLLDNDPESQTAEPPLSVRLQKGALELFGVPNNLHRRIATRRMLMDDCLRGLSDYAPAYGAEIIKHCAQLQGFQRKQGNIPEPLWYANLGLLAFCEDGDDLAHELSKGDPRYSFAQTQEKLDRQRKIGPTKCKRFHELNLVPCQACKHWGHISSPIALGHLHLPHGTEPQTSATPASRVMPRGWELMKGGARKSNSYTNTVLAIDQLGIRFRHDVFHDKKIVEGDATENLGPELSDPACRAIRDLIIARFDFDPGIVNVQQAAERACEVSRFDPVCDYLDALQWDGQPRLDRWLENYLNAEDTSLNRAFGRAVLIAAVRRARDPGCKFDYMMVLEGRQGSGKSSALRILAGEGNFSDQPVIHLDPRAQQEALKGVWIFEISELAGLRRTEVETVKAFISKTSDDARRAYDRFRVDQARRCVFIGTTNDDTYLQDATGNRRFWPVRTGTIDLDALQRDREQLLAEAAAAERRGEQLTIPERLFGPAAEQQEQRMIADEWEGLLANVKGEIYYDGGTREERISSAKLLTVHLGLTPDRITTPVSKRLANAMRRLGWRGPKKIAAATRGFWRPVT
jgi:hypothetical protein